MLKQRSILVSANVIYKNFCHIEIQHSNEVYDDKTNETISEKFHRHVLTPGEFKGAEDDGVLAIAKRVWTKEVLASYKKYTESQNTPPSPQ